MQSANASFDNLVSQALQRIGVDAAGFVDEIAAIGLPERRSQDAWEAAAKQ